MKKAFLPPKFFAGIRAACRKIQAHFKWGCGRVPALFLRGWRFWKGGPRSFGRKFSYAFQASPRRLSFILQASREGIESLIRLLKTFPFPGYAWAFQAVLDS